MSKLSDSDSDYSPDDNLNNGYETDDGFVVNDNDSINYHSSDDELEMNRRKKWKKRKAEKKENPLLKKIKENIKNKKLTYDDICNSNIPFEEKVWFIEHIRILNNMDMFSIEYYDLKSYIYNKFNDYNNMSKDDIKKQKQINKINENKESLKQKILRSGFNDNIIAQLYKRYELLLQAGENNEDKHKHMEWIDWVLNIPRKSKKVFDNNNSLSKNLRLLQSNLNKRLYGMKNVKDRILEIVSSIYTNPDCKNRCIGLIGPPGVGKTVLAQTIAESLKLPFSQISLGGAKDSSFLRGHSSTYIGSRPGIIVSSLRKMGFNNGVMLFDELDKIQNTLEGSEVKSSLLHILDYSQNKDFHDDFMPDISIDLSKIFFIISLNSINNNNNNIDQILSDRIPIIKVDGYDKKDRINIGLNYIIPKILKELNINKKHIIFNKGIMEYIISKQIREESGVRQLERNLRIIIERINLLKSQYVSDKEYKNNLKLDYFIDDFKIPFVLRKKDINKLFSESNY